MTDTTDAELQRLRAIVARVTRAVDAGPVGSCCAHLIHAALNPPTGTAVTKEPT